jgi:hypothetical protein
MQSYDYECALTGLTQEGSDYYDEDLADLPPNWTRVTIQKREYNPKWLMIQQVKQMAIQGLLSQLPPEVQQAQAWAISLQVEAQFHELEKDTPRFLTNEEVVYLSDNPDVLDPYNELREALGLELVEDDDDDDDDDSEDLADESHLPHDGVVGDDDDEDDED